MSLLTNITNYWKMDGNSNDSVGSLNGTDVSVTYSNPNGIINQGVGFNLTASRIALGAMTFAANGTFNFWVKGAMNDGAIVVDSITPRIFISFVQGPTKIELLYVTGGIGTPVAFNSLGTGFNMFTIVWDGTNQTYYQNASQLGSPQTYNPGSVTTTSTVFGNDTTFATGFTAPLDEIGLWSRALSGSEITQLYNGGAGLQYPFVSTAIKTINGLATASVKTVNGLAIASVKTWNGLA